LKGLIWRSPDRACKREKVYPPWRERKGNEGGGKPPFTVTREKGRPSHGNYGGFISVHIKEKRREWHSSTLQRRGVAVKGGIIIAPRQKKQPESGKDLLFLDGRSDSLREQGKRVVIV